MRLFINNYLLRHYRNWRYGPPYEGKTTKEIIEWAEKTLP